MRILFSTCLAALAAFSFCPAFAAREIQNISMPMVSSDGQTVYFGCWGDIWSAPRDGSAPARRLTDNVAFDDRPILSPDETQIAFLSDRFGSYDLFVMPAEGGPATRLSYNENPDQHYAWKADGSALLAYVMRQDLWAYSGYEFPLDGSAPRRVSGPDHDHHVNVNYLGDTGKFVYARGPGSWAQKHYHGSRNYDIWTYDPASGHHQQYTDYDGDDLWPQPSPDGAAVYFISDRDGTDNIWVLEMATGDQRQLTHFRGDGPRWPRISNDGDEIACEVFGELYIVPVDGASPEKIEVAIADDFKHEMEVTTDFNNHIGEYALSPNGSYFAVTVYGDIYLLKNPEVYEEGEEPEQDLSRTHALVTTSGREMDLSWHPDSTKLCYISDRDGQYDVYLLDLATREETQLTDTPVEEAWPQFAPQGERIAYYSGNRELRLYDLESDEDILVHEGLLKWGPWPAGFWWAPDGYWFVYAEDLLDYQQELYLMNVEDLEPVELSKAMDWNGRVAFSPDGKYLAFAHETDTGADVMLLELDPEEPTYDLELLFPEDLPAEDEEEPAEEAETEEDAAAEAEGGAGEEEDKAEVEEDRGEEAEDQEGETEDEEEIEPLSIDLNRIHLRAEPLTAFTGSAYSLAFDPNSEYLLFASDHTGENEWWTITLEEREPSRLGGAQELASPQFAPDGARLYYLEGQRVGYFEMSGPQSSGGGSVQFTSRYDYDQYAIWEQVLTEGWRTLDQSFYDPLLGGVDWDEVLRRYLPRVRDCATAYEYGTLYRGMLGELGRSHLGYWGYGDERELPADSTADLGVYWDEDYSGPGWRVSRVVPDGPATVPGARLYAGDVVLAINGMEVAAGESREMLLNNLVDEPLKLTVQNGGEALAQLAAEEEAAADEPAADDGGEERDGAADVSTDTREVLIKPADQAAVDQLRYELWVEDNRARVYEMSGGRIGYQHIERMYGDALQKFRRELFTESANKDALIIDVRFNGGGNTAVDVMNVLDERPAYLRARRDDPVLKYGRQYVWQGPLVVLVNAYSFSNAEIFAHIMKDSNLATIIGEPTPGGVISTSSIQLLDGSWLGIPSGGNFRLSGEDMEGPGAGAQPDIVVLIDPEQLAQGNDNQLETAVDYLLDELAEAAE